MRLAVRNDRIHAAGGEIVAISVDSEQRQAAMFRRWPTPHIRYVSDPGGERYLRPIGMFDPDERGGIGRPGLFVIAPDGAVAYEYRGGDFADRRNDEEMDVALAGLGLDPIEPVAGGPLDESVDAGSKGAFQPEMLTLYFRGSRSGALAVQLRARGDEAVALAREHRWMADGILEAWNEIRPRT